ncbi:conserved hypothetical protein [Ricinus communis]|uniref:Uncharacterized protein n=1 Tax=Ricinus communis TaxID=3988 RepID=B9SHV7_RICCO|nr:conserved hypothetical protein [Ricinus communis]
MAGSSHDEAESTKTPQTQKRSYDDKVPKKEEGKSGMSKAAELKSSTTSLSSNSRPNGLSGGNPLGSYCSIKLNQENYFLLKNLVLPVIRGNRLERFITGSKKCSLEFVISKLGDGDLELTENPKYEEWIVQDQIQ